MAINLDTGLRMQAMDFAKNIINDIIESSNKPNRTISGESLKVFEDLESWGIFDTHPITDSKNSSFYIFFVATNKYRQLNDLKENPEIEKKTKWEVVMGKASTNSSNQALKAVSGRRKI